MERSQAGAGWGMLLGQRAPPVTDTSQMTCPEKACHLRLPRLVIREAMARDRETEARSSLLPF